MAACYRSGKVYCLVAAKLANISESLICKTGLRRIYHLVLLWWLNRTIIYVCCKAHSRFKKWQFLRYGMWWKNTSLLPIREVRVCRRSAVCCLDSVFEALTLPAAKRSQLSQWVMMKSPKECSRCLNADIFGRPSGLQSSLEVWPWPLLHSQCTLALLHPVLFTLSPCCSWERFPATYFQQIRLRVSVRSTQPRTAWLAERWNFSPLAQLKCQILRSVICACTPTFYSLRTCHMSSTVDLLQSFLKRVFSSWNEHCS